MHQIKNNIHFIYFIGCFVFFVMFLFPVSVSATIACGICEGGYCRICDRELDLIDAFGVERRVANASDSIDLFVPIGDVNDWDNFRDRYAEGKLPSDFIVAPSVCGNGKYWDENIQWWVSPTTDLACTLTPCGYYSEKDDEKIACSAGNYQPNTGQTSCIPASAGYRVAGGSACGQTVCTAGNYQPNTGQTSCIPASAGHFVSSSAATSQTPCSAGTYQPNTGRTSCLTCSTCRWSGQGASSCDFVAAGQDPGSHCTAAGLSCVGSCTLTSATGYCDGGGECAVEEDDCPPGSACSGGTCTSETYCAVGEWNCSGECSTERAMCWCDGAGACGGGNQTTQTANCAAGSRCSNGACVDADAVVPVSCWDDCTVQTCEEEECGAADCEVGVDCEQAPCACPEGYSGWCFGGVCECFSDPEPI